MRTIIESPRRVLVVDNDEHVIQSVLFNLRMAGYEVIIADTVEEALRLIGHEIFHAAVIDIRLKDESEEDDQSGFEVARHLPPYVPRIIYTAYENIENLRAAFTEAGARYSVDKRNPNAPDLLVDNLDQLFKDEVKVNFALDIQSAFDLSELAGMIRMPADSRYPEPRAEDVQRLLQTLFYSAEAIQATYLLPPEAAPTRSQSGAVLITVHPRLPNGLAEPVVVKLSSCDEIEREVQGYNQIEPFLGGQRHADMRGHAYSRGLGGLVYSFINADELGDIHVFDDLFANAPADEIIQLRRQFFTRTFRQIFSDATREPIDLAAMYSQALGLTPQKLRQAIAERRPNAAGELQLHFKGLPGTYPNPLLWVLHGDIFRRLDTIARVCLCHGDLHGRNILVDSAGRFWLLDFARVDRSHALRDFAELETDIKFELLRTADLGQLLRFEQALLAPTLFSDQAAADAFGNAQIDKAYQVIVALRALAAEQLNLHEDMDEYYQALLFHTLNVLRLRRPSADKKEHALLAAALICQRLDNWPTWQYAPTPAEPPVLPPPALPGTADHSSTTTIMQRLGGVVLFLLIGVGVIAALWGLMHVLRPSPQEQIMTLVTLSILIIPAFAIVGLISGTAAVRALLGLLGRFLPKHKNDTEPPPPPTEQ